VADVPLIDLTMPAGTLDAEARGDLVRKLGSTLLRWEGAPDTDFFKSIMWVHVHELPGEAVTAAGVAVTEPHFRLDVTVPEGALSERRKEGAVKELTEAVLEAAELDDSAGLRVWVLVHEVPEGNWGAAGQIVRFSRLREMAAQEREAAAATPSG
jgi:phenylpyruvate tautomerase PptA (4-oxalocrotonate tautomerase family)